MTTTAILWLFFWLFTKHFVVDFPLQANPYQYKNKGTYGHAGGILHSGLHGIATFLVLSFFVPSYIAAWLSIADFTVHYHIDWAKMNLNKKTGWGPLTSEWFWIALGFDQYLHYLTYLAIVVAAVNLH